MRFILIVILFLSAVPASALDVRDRLNLFLTEVKTLSATFRQQVFDEQGNSIQEARGRLKLFRPGRFRWAYETPSEQLILADGKNLWIYDVELEQATVKPIDETLAATPVILLTELRPLDREFFIQEARSRENLDWARLIPKTQDTEFLRIELGLKGNEVRQMELYDQFGQTTIIRFEGVMTNLPLPASEFRFEVPPGVDVIGTGQ
jgi:outer membrane lipoprotein carrier protein